MSDVDFFAIEPTVEPTAYCELFHCFIPNRPGQDPDDHEHDFKLSCDWGWLCNQCDTRSALVRRLHIVREDGKFPGRHGYCGIQVGPVKHSKAAVIDPMPTVAPLGLAWCGKCVGEHADRVGLINTFASVLAVEGLS